MNMPSLKDGFDYEIRIDGQWTEQCFYGTLDGGGGLFTRADMSYWGFTLDDVRLPTGIRVRFDAETREPEFHRWNVGPGRDWHDLMTVPSRSRPGTSHTISRSPDGMQVACSCRGFKFAKVQPHTCRHMDVANQTLGRTLYSRHDAITGK